MHLSQPTQTNYCSYCGHPVEPGAIFCSNCGTQLDQFSDLNPKQEPPFSSHHSQESSFHNHQIRNEVRKQPSLKIMWLVLIPIGLFMIVLMVKIINPKSQNSVQPNSGSSLSQPTIKPFEPNSFSEIQPTITSVPISTEALGEKQPTPVKISSTSAENSTTNSKKPTSSCPGAPDQRLTVGENARVCTKSDKVYLRKEPSKDSDILTSAKPGAVIKIINGPECANDYSFWKVELSNGSTGWMAEGGDKTDPYFLCPVLTTGSGSISGHLYYPSDFIPSGYVVAINNETNEMFYVENELNQLYFQIENLPPGKYYVMRYSPYDSFPDQQVWVNTYTKYVDCVRASSDNVPMCNDHTLIPVEVYAGQTTEDIHLMDFILTTEYGLPTNPLIP